MKKEKKGCEGSVVLILSLAGIVFFVLIVLNNLFRG